MVAMSVRFHRSGRVYVLETEVLLGRPIEGVFAFFADAGNLERITPSFLGFEILTPRPIEMREGTLIDYRIRLHGLSMRWRTRIAAWEPPHRFVDEQLRGPYRRWVHEHRFEAQDDATRCRDRVEYAFLGGPLAHARLVRPRLEQIFEFRRQAMLELMGRPSGRAD
jgi:ligand-binding SRPBCC domain-containing protein